MSWNEVREQARVPQPDNISAIVSTDDPDLASKLNNHKPGSWLVVRGSNPFIAKGFQFGGWVKLEVPEIGVGWELNAIKGIGGDPRLWIENCVVKSGANGGGYAKSMFYGLNKIYANQCLFIGFTHTIVDLNKWHLFSGAVINCEFRDQRADPFQQYTGDVVNVNIKNVVYVDGAHADLAQWTSRNIQDIYWRSVHCASAENPQVIMGLRGFEVTDSWFEDVRHYQYPGTGHHSVQFSDGTNTTFKNCILTGQIDAPGITFINDDTSSSSSSSSSSSIPPSGNRELYPGSGWDSETATPPDIPGAKEKTVAAWNVVPFQIINESFSVGVGASHLDGMDRVEIAIDNGPWVTISEESYNPRTKIEEYWAIIDPSNFTEDKLYTLRAIAYPKQGVPKVLEDIPINVNPNGTLDHEYLLLDAGRHEINGLKSPSDRWLVIKPKPGVNKEDVILFGGSNKWGIHRPGPGNVKFENVIYDLKGHTHWWYSANNADNCVWADNVEFLGNPELFALHRNVLGAFYTDCKFGSCKALLGYAPSRFKLLARNTYIPHCYEDVIRTSGTLFKYGCR